LTVLLLDLLSKAFFKFLSSHDGHISADLPVLIVIYLLLPNFKIGYMCQSYERRNKDYLKPNVSSPRKLRSKNLKVVLRLWEKLRKKFQTVALKLHAIWSFGTSANFGNEQQKTFMNII